MKTVKKPRPQNANLKPRQKGQPSLNPVGRPKGSRNRLGEAFVADMCLAWEKNGIDAIERVVAERPADFLKLVAGILPKEIDNKDTTLDDMSHDDVKETLAAVRRLIAEGAGAPPAPEGEPAASKDQIKGLCSKHIEITRRSRRRQGG